MGANPSGAVEGAHPGISRGSAGGPGGALFYSRPAGSDGGDHQISRARQHSGEHRQSRQSEVSSGAEVAMGGAVQLLLERSRTRSLVHPHVSVFSIPRASLSEPAPLDRGATEAI